MEQRRLKVESRSEFVRSGRDECARDPGAGSGDRTERQIERVSVDLGLGQKPRRAGDGKPEPGAAPERARRRGVTGRGLHLEGGTKKDELPEDSGLPGCA